MKRIILITILCFVIGTGISFGFYGDNKGPDISISKEYPQYLLVYRTWESGPCKSEPGTILYGCWDWVYHYDTYDSLNKVIKQLNNWAGWTYDGNFGLENKDTIVGLWKLNGADGNIFDKTFKQRIVEHSKKIRIEEKNWTEYVWEKTD